MFLVFGFIHIVSKRHTLLACTTTILCTNGKSEYIQIVLAMAWVFNTNGPGIHHGPFSGQWQCPTSQMKAMGYNPKSKEDTTTDEGIHTDVIPDDPEQSYRL